MPYVNNNFPVFELKNTENLDFKIDDQEFNFESDNLNMLEGSAIAQQIIDPETYEVFIKKKPRTPYPEFHFAKNVKKFVWSFPISLFKDYKQDITKLC